MNKKILSGLITATVLSMGNISYAASETNNIVMTDGEYSKITVTSGSSSRLNINNGLYKVMSAVYGATVTMSGSAPTIDITDNGVDLPDNTAMIFGLLNANIVVANGQLEMTATAIGKQTDNIARANVSAYGMYAATNLDNSIVGDAKITISATGGKATSTIGSVWANSEAYGLYAEGKGKNSLTGNYILDIKSQGGTADGKGGANTDGQAYGFYTYSSAGGALNTATGNVNMTVQATGGTSNDDASAYAHGLYVVNNYGSSANRNIITGASLVSMDITARGGTANANMSGVSAATDTSANGMYVAGDPTTIASNEITADNVNIKIQAYGGTAHSSYSGAGANATAIGMNAQGGGSNKITGNVYMDLYAKSGTASSSNNSVVHAAAIARGMDASSGGTNTIDGNVVIKGDVDLGTAGKEFRVYSMYAVNGGINDLSAAGKLKQLEGDVRSYSRSGGVAENKIVLDTKGSYLQGNLFEDAGSGSAVPTEGKNTLIVSNGATWRPVYDNRYGSYWQAGNQNSATHVKDYKVNDMTVKEITLKDQGIIDLTWDGWSDDGTYAKRDTYRKLTIKQLNGSGGILRLDTDIANGKGDKVTINTADNGSTLGIMVNYDPFYDLTDKTISGTVSVVGGSAVNNITVVGAESEYNDKVYLPNVEFDSTDNTWDITSIDYVGVKKKDGSATTNVLTAADARVVLTDLWLINTNDLSKRLGDLRLNAFDNIDAAGIWAKYGHGNEEIGHGRKADLNYNSFQAGYDKSQTVNSGKIYRGFTVSHVDGSSSYETGNGKANSTMFGLYQTWVGKSGHYYDIILKTGRLSNDYSMTDASNNYSTAGMSSWATTLSGEYGYRKQLRDGVYVEPQVEMIAGYINSYDYTTSRGMHVTADSSKHLITRLGLSIGQNTKHRSLYLTGSYYHDFGGTGGISTSAVRYERSDRITNWYELSVGSTFRTGKNSNLYLEVNKYFGDLKSNLNFQVGARWSF